MIVMARIAIVRTVIEMRWPPGRQRGYNLAMAMNRRVFGVPPARAAGGRGWNAAWEILVMAMATSIPYWWKSAVDRIPDNRTYCLL